MKPFLRLQTFGVYRGVATYNMATSLDGVYWHWWGLSHLVVWDWYLFILQCLLSFQRECLVLDGIDKLEAWRLSL